MRTVAKNIEEVGAQLSAEIEELLGEDVPLRDINKEDGMVIYVGGSNAFEELPATKKPQQSKLLEDNRHFFSICRVLLRAQPQEVHHELDSNEQLVRQAIARDELVWHNSTGEAKIAVKGAIKASLESISALYDSAEGSVILVPDTNALLFNPVLAKWTFEEIPQFELLLFPAVLHELDKLKVHHRNDGVREKAESVIRQIKEYRRRGKLSEGIDVVKNRIRLRTVAVEPKVEDAFPWLDENSQDDRILASSVEAMRRHSRSAVALITRDINLQNKADYAHVPILEPPNPAPG